MQMHEGEEDAGAFPMHHGRLALSFVGTVGDRGSLRTERLTTPRALGRWIRDAHLCERDVVPSPALYRRALVLREAIARSVEAVIGARRAAVGDIARINEIATRLAPRPTLDPVTLCLVGSRQGPVEAALGRIAVDAIEMFASAEERSRLRTCSLETCGALFLTSQGHRERRWCSMARCGNRAKVAAFRRRAAADA